ADAAEGAALPVEVDLALVRAVRVDAGEHLHQRRLAGAVLAADGVDLTAPHGQVDVLQRLDAGERLGDPGHPQNVVGHVSCPSVGGPGGRAVPRGAGPYLSWSSV